MSKFLLSLILSCSLTLSVDSFAQKCNFDKDETDPFTKEHVRSTSQMRLSGTPRWWAMLEQKGNKYSMVLSIFMMKEIKQSIAKGTKMQIKLEDGTVLEPTAAADAVPTFNVEQQRYIVSQWTVHVDLTEDMLKKMGGSPIELIRTKIGNDDCNMPDAHSKGTNKLMELAACMLSKG